MPESFLRIDRIKKSFGAAVAVENIALDVSRGEFLTFLGPSGSGKSTTLYIVAGLQEPTEGDVLLNGRSLLRVPSHRRNIGMVFQQYTLFPHLTIAENIAFPLRVRRQPAAQIDAKVNEMLSLVQLGGLGKRMPGELSGGQQQRVALARALAYDPPVLLMDEPLSALDKKLREELQYEIKRIHNATGVTILYVTHDQEEALRLSDRIVIFNSGRVEQVGTGSDLYLKPASQFVAGFIGNSNFLVGHITQEAGGFSRVLFPDGSESLALRSGQGGLTGDCVVQLRPENIRFRSGEPGKDAGLKVKILDITFLGEKIHVIAETAWGQKVKILRMPSGEGAEPVSIGDVARICWKPEDVIVFPGQR